MTGRKALFIALVAAAAVGSAFLFQAAGRAASPGDSLEPTSTDSPAKVVTVRTSPVQTRSFEDRLIIQGNLEARTVVEVSARVPGVIEEIYVDEGDAVEEGKTRLFQVDALKLSKAVSVARNDLAAARHSLREKKRRPGKGAGR